MGKKTGVLELFGSGNGDVHGKVWLVQGKVTHAESHEGSEGAPALIRLLHSAAGRFSFETSAVAGSEARVTIDRSLDVLLLEASMDGPG